MQSLSNLAFWKQNNRHNLLQKVRIKTQGRKYIWLRLVLFIIGYLMIPVALITAGYTLFEQPEAIAHKLGNFSELKVRSVYLNVMKHNKKIAEVDWKIKKSEIENIVASTANRNVFDISLEDLRKEILKVSWIKKASVRLSLPDTLIITVDEKIPYATWQSNRIFYLIDKEGTIITSENVMEYGDLPCLAGKYANKEAPKILNEVIQYSEIFNNVKCFEYVGGRRWRLVLHGLNVELAAENPTQSLQNLQEFYREYGLSAGYYFEGKKIIEIDARAKDKISLRTQEQANIQIPTNEQSSI